MNPKKTGHTESRDAPLGTTPDDLPGRPPPSFRADDHSWVLQTIMELHGSTKALTQAVQTLSADSKEQGKKLDAISHKVYAAIAVLVVTGTAVGFLMNHMWDKIIDVLAKVAALK